MWWLILALIVVFAVLLLAVMVIVHLVKRYNQLVVKHTKLLDTYWTNIRTLRQVREEKLTTERTLKALLNLKKEQP